MNQSEINRKKIQAFSYSLGVAVLWILGLRIRENGIAYMACALELFYVLSIPVGSAFSDVLGRTLRLKNAKEQYKDAEKIRGQVIKVQVILGVVLTAILFALAGVLADKVIGVTYVRYALYFLAPALLFRSVNGAVQGCFQGQNLGIASVVASYMRQVLLLVFGLIFTGSFMKYGEKAGRLLLQKHVSVMYGSMGIALSVLCSEAVVCLFLVIVYRVGRKQMLREEEGMRSQASPASLAAGVYRAALLPMLVRFLVFLPMPVGMILYRQGVTGDVNEMGIYGALTAGVFLVYCFALFPIMGTLNIYSAKVEAKRRREGNQTGRGVFLNGLHSAMTNTFYVTGFAIGSAFMIVTILTPYYSERATRMLTIGAALMILLAFSLYCTSMLITVGKELFALGGPIIFMVSFTIAGFIFGKAGAGAYLILYAGLIAGVLFAIWEGIFTFRAYKVSLNHLNMLLMPFVGSVITWAICFAISKLLAPHIGVWVGLILSLALSLPLYWAALLVTRNFKESELRDMLGGEFLISLGKKTGVF